MTRYCHACAVIRGRMPAVTGSCLTGNTYLLGKFVKHTFGTGVYPGLNGVFPSPDYNCYESYVVQVGSSGWYEVDASGRESMTFYAGASVGVTYLNGKYHAPADAVRLVIACDTGKMHAFPFSASADLVAATCDDCGRPYPV